MRKKDKGFYDNTSEATKTIVLKHKEDFMNVHGIFHQKLAINNTAASDSVSFQVDTILWYHWDIKHILTRNLYKLIKGRCWWSFMTANINEVL